MFENPRRGRQERNFTTNVPKILDLKSSSEQIFSENWRWAALFASKIRCKREVTFDHGCFKTQFCWFFLLFFVLLVCARCVIFTMTIQVPITRVKLTVNTIQPDFFVLYVSVCACFFSVFKFWKKKKKNEEAGGEIKILGWWAPEFCVIPLGLWNTHWSVKPFKIAGRGAYP